MSAGGVLMAVGVWWGVFPEEAAVGMADRLDWEELVVFGKLSPSPRSSSSRGGEALVIPAWVSCSRGRDSGRGSSPSRPAFWSFCLSSAVAPLSSCTGKRWHIVSQITSDRPLFVSVGKCRCHGNNRIKKHYWNEKKGKHVSKSVNTNNNKIQ